VPLETNGSSTATGCGRTAAWLAKQVEVALADVELSLPQYRVLALLAEGSIIPSAMAEKLAVRRPTVTAVVDGLVARDLVERNTPPGDRRQVSHRLTEPGRRLLAGADEAVDDRLAAIVGKLATADDQARATAGLGLWLDAMAAYHGVPSR